MVSAPDSVSRGTVSSPGRVIVLCSWARHFTLTVPLSTKGTDFILPLSAMGTGKLSGKPDEMLGVTYDGTSIPSRRGSNTPGRFML